MGDDKGFGIIIVSAIVLFFIVSVYNVVNFKIDEVKILRSNDLCAKSGIYHILVSKMASAEKRIVIDCQDGSTEYYRGTKKIEK